MAKMSLDNMRAMKYGAHLIGAHMHMKLRCVSSLVDKMLTDNELKPYLSELTVIHNKQRTHAHVAGVFHQNTGFMDIFYRVRKRQEAKAMMVKAKAILGEQTSLF